MQIQNAAYCLLCCPVTAITPLIIENKRKVTSCSDWHPFNSDIKGLPCHSLPQYATETAKGNLWSPCVLAQLFSGPRTLFGRRKGRRWGRECEERLKWWGPEDMSAWSRLSAALWTDSWSIRCSRTVRVHGGGHRSQPDQGRQLRQDQSGALYFTGTWAHNSDTCKPLEDANWLIDVQFGCPRTYSQITIRVSLS